MRAPSVSPPEGLSRATERITEIKARFRSVAGDFATTLATAQRPAAGEVKQALARAAREHGLDEKLLRAVAEVESGLRPEAVSPKGALGVMQLMPGTARSLGLADPFDAQTNIDAGARYLRGLLDQFGGDTTLALAAYNAGPGAVKRYDGVPPFAETKGFIARVLSRLDGGGG